MAIKASNAYLEGRVLAANGLELVCMLYEHALDRIAGARACLKNGDIAGRSKHITQAQETLLELEGSLDHGRGGQLSQNLLGLYGYLRGQLMQAHVEQRDEPLAEAAHLLSTLLEGWRGCRLESESLPQPGYLAASEPQFQEADALSWAG
jgi:flagellar protein FliS